MMAMMAFRAGGGGGTEFERQRDALLQAMCALAAASAPARTAVLQQLSSGCVPPATMLKAGHDDKYMRAYGS